jgi:MoaA/NifB/PqqE/SkfB family radical SAM enzyme
MQENTISLLQFDWAALNEPANYAAVVRAGFGSGGASNADVAAHLMPPLTRLEAAQIEITTFCNFACRECSRTKEIAANTWKNIHIPLERYQAIVDKLPPTRMLYLQGVGEPSMHPHFYQLLKSASDSDKFDSLHFNTNAHTHDDAYWQSLAGFKGITVGLSVDSLDPDIAERCRSGTDTDLLWHRLTLFRDTFQWFIVALVASRLNIDDIETTLRRIAALGKVPVQITRVMSDDPEVVLHASDETLLTERIETIRRDFPDFSVYFNANNSGFAANEKRCVSPFLSPYFTADGHLTPCCNAVSPAHYGYVRADDDRDWNAVRSDAGVMKWVGSFINADPPICEGCTLNPNQKTRIKTNVVS